MWDALVGGKRKSNEGVAKAPRKLQETFSRVRLETTPPNLVASKHLVEDGEDEERDVLKPNMVGEG
jgi:hypothetical protein